MGHVLRVHPIAESILMDLSAQAEIQLILVRCISIIFQLAPVGFDEENTS